MAYARSYGPANPLNQVASEAGVSLAFDVRGNMTGDGTWTFGFDQRNRLVSATKPGTAATYDYDGDDRRTKKTVNGVVTRIVWSGEAELAEADAAGAILRRYVPGAAIDTPQAMIAAGGTVTWLHPDGQGSIVNTSTSAGAAGTPITYSPYGEIGGTGALPSGLPFGYTGRYFDAETGLWYYRARYYHPRLGQFLQTDPIGTKDDPNLYLYVGGDPVNGTDPSGQICHCELSWNIASDFPTDDEQRAGAHEGVHNGADQDDSAFAEFDDDYLIRISGGAPIPPQLTAYYQQPYIPDVALPAEARTVLYSRQAFVDPKSGVVSIILHLAPGYRSVPAPRGGGMLLVPPRWNGGLANVVRFQPVGTGSARPGGRFSGSYPTGYYVVYNSVGLPISIYTGQPGPPPLVHNPYRAVTPGLFDLFGW